MAGLSLSQRHALRVTLAATNCLLIKLGQKYSTNFIGGTRVAKNTVESLIAAGLMQRVQGGPAVTLTGTGRTVAGAAKLEHDQAEAAAKANTAKFSGRNRATFQARNPYGRQPQPVETTSRRLPYADN